MTQCVHPPPSSHWTTTVDLAERTEGFFWVSFILTGLQGFILCIMVYVYRCLFIWNKRSCICLLSNTTVGLESPASPGVHSICNKAGIISWLVSMHFCLLI